MSTPKVPLTGTQKNALHRVLADPHMSPDFAATGEVNPHLRVFVVNFDGTTNDCSRVPDGEHQTLVATLAQNIKSGGPIQSRYYPGVGTATRSGLGALPNLAVSKLEAAFGFGCQGKAEQAYADLIEAAEQWRREDPLVKVHVHVVGFSRGAATALHFMNLVDSRGIKPVPNGHFHGRPQPKAFAPGSVKTSAVLLDTVATGQSNYLNLTLPATAISVLHLVAGSEERRLFPLTPVGDSGRPDKLNRSDWALAVGVRAPPPRAGHSATHFSADGSFLYKRLQQISIDGARHSDIGDAYGEGYIGKVAEYLSLTFQASLGLPVPAPIRPHFGEIQSAFGHDSRFGFDKLADSVLEALGEEVCREDVKRLTATNNPVPWNGDLIRTTTLTLSKDGKPLATHKLRLALPAEPGRPLPTEQDCKRRFRSSCRHKGPEGALSLSSRSGRLRIAADQDNRPRLMFGQEMIDDLTEADSVFQRLLDREPGVEMSIDISYKKQIVPLFNAAQRIAPGSIQPPLAPAIDDPWPAAIQTHILMLNDYRSRPQGHPALTQEQALAIMTECMSEAARALKASSPDTTKVRFAEDLGMSHSRGQMHYLERIVSLSCTGNRIDRTAMFSKHSICANAREFALQARMRDMEEALTAVVRLLRKEGFDVARGCALEIGVGETPYMAKHEAQSIETTQIPVGTELQNLPQMRAPGAFDATVQYHDGDRMRMH